MQQSVPSQLGFRILRVYYSPHGLEVTVSRFHFVHSVRHYPEKSMVE